MGFEEAASSWPPTATVFPIAAAMMALAVLWERKSSDPGPRSVGNDTLALKNVLALDEQRTGPRGWIDWLIVACAVVFVAQSSLAAAPLVAVLVGIAAWIAVWRRVDVRNLLPALTITALAWVPVAYEQLTDAHPNISLVMGGAGRSEHRFGLRRAFAAEFGTTGTPFGWLGPRYFTGSVPTAQIGFGTTTHPLAVWVVGLGLIAIAIGAALVVRRGHQRVALGGTAAAAAIAIVLSRLPYENAFTSVGWIRWLWPIALMLWWAVSLMVVRSLPRRGAAVNAVVVVVAAALVGVPAAYSIARTPSYLRSVRHESHGFDRIRASVLAAVPKGADVHVEFDLAGAQIAAPIIGSLERSGHNVTGWTVVPESDTARLTPFGDERRTAGDAELSNATRSDAARSEVPRNEVPRNEVTVSLMWIDSMTEPPESGVDVVGCGYFEPEKCRQFVAAIAEARTDADQRRVAEAMQAEAARSGGIPTVALVRVPAP